MDGTADCRVYSEDLVQRVADILYREGHSVLAGRYDTGDDRWVPDQDAARVVLDALAADGRLVPEGSDIREEWGCPVDVTEVFAAVHAANMAKLGANGRPLVDRHGKAMKPPGWKPADVAGVLLRVG